MSLSHNDDLENDLDVDLENDLKVELGNVLEPESFQVDQHLW